MQRPTFGILVTPFGLSLILLLKNFDYVLMFIVTNINSLVDIYAIAELSRIPIRRQQMQFTLRGLR